MSSDPAGNKNEPTLVERAEQAKQVRNSLRRAVRQVHIDALEILRQQREEFLDKRVVESKIMIVVKALNTYLEVGQKSGFFNCPNLIDLQIQKICSAMMVAKVDDVLKALVAELRKAKIDPQILEDL